MKMKTARWLVLAIFAMCLGSCRIAAGEIGFWNWLSKTDISGSVSLRYDKGIFTDDFYFTNNSSQIAEDVSVEFTIIGVKGNTRTVKEYWGIWKPRETRKASASSMGGVQRIDVRMIAAKCYVNTSFYVNN